MITQESMGGASGEAHNPIEIQTHLSPEQREFLLSEYGGKDEERVKVLQNNRAIVQTEMLENILVSFATLDSNVLIFMVNHLSDIYCDWFLSLSSADSQYNLGAFMDRYAHHPERVLDDMAKAHFLTLKENDVTRTFENFEDYMAALVLRSKNPEAVESDLEPSSKIVNAIVESVHNEVVPDPHKDSPIS